MGTYITPVASFLEGYLEYYTQIQQDKGYDDYETPAAGQYAYCTRKVVNGNEYWLQMGCSDGTSQNIAVNIYTDNTCTTRSKVDGSDDANVDVSDIQVCAEVSLVVSRNVERKKSVSKSLFPHFLLDSFQEMPSLRHVGR
jgi:hypothetical protein